MLYLLYPSSKGQKMLKFHTMYETVSPSKINEKAFGGTV
jgi:hypothetical protein